jgi:S1-C subfamily serine protease
VDQCQAHPRDDDAAPAQRPYLGTVPDFGAADGGLRLGGVGAGSPADLAGLRAGDILVRLGDVEIDSLQDLQDALGAHAPGDTVVLEWLRDGRRMTAEATLTRRQ